MEAGERLTVRQAGAGDAERWDRYVQAHPGALAYHRFAWKQAMEAAYGLRCPYLLAERDGNVRGVLPLALIRFPLLKRELVSLPYCDVGGVLADDEGIEADIARAAIDVAKALKADRVSVRQGSLKASEDTSPIEAPKVRMVLELPGSAEALMGGFKSTFRTKVKKPGKEGLTCVLGGPELVDEFYGVFKENMRDLGSPVHSRRWLRSVVEAYGDNARVGVVRLPDGATVAGGVILANGDTVVNPWASALRKYSRQKPNMLLYWTFLAFAADAGFARFDFGRSTPGEGTYDFKAHWGAVPVPLRWTDLDSAGRPLPCSGNGVGRARTLAAAVIAKLPVPVATCLGTMVRRYVSL